jgi:hypothetical protein
MSRRNIYIIGAVVAFGLVWWYRNKRAGAAPSAMSGTPNILNWPLPWEVANTADEEAEMRLYQAHQNSRGFTPGKNR